MDLAGASSENEDAADKPDDNNATQVSEAFVKTLRSDLDNFSKDLSDLKNEVREMDRTTIETGNQIWGILTCADEAAAHARVTAQRSATMV